MYMPPHSQSHNNPVGQARLRVDFTDPRPQKEGGGGDTLVGMGELEILVQNSAPSPWRPVQLHLPHTPKVGLYYEPWSPSV